MLIFWAIVWNRTLFHAFATDWGLYQRYGSMSKVAEYLLQAEFCKSMAERTASLEGKARWLDLAAKWLGLADERVQAEPFEVMAQDDGTTKERSRSGTG